MYNIHIIILVKTERDAQITSAIVFCITASYTANWITHSIRLEKMKKHENGKEVCETIDREQCTEIQIQGFDDSGEENTLVKE